MEVYANADEKVSVIVDYAHNRLSFETLFRSVREEYPGRRIVTVFGCPGYKAYDRRKDLGEISGQYSDLVILTEEDPRRGAGGEHLPGHRPVRGPGDQRLLHRPRPRRSHQAGCDELRRAPRSSCSPARGRRPAKSAASSILTAPLT